MGRMHVCLTLTCHLHFWQNDQYCLRATAATRGGTDTEIRVSTEKYPGEETSPAAPAGTRIRDLLVSSPTI